MTDERQGLPSASGFYMEAACDGRQNLLRTLLPHELAPERDVEMASRGDRIHDALQTGDVSLLTEDEMVDWAKCKEAEKKIYDEWRDGADALEYRERRMWLHDGKGQPLVSGKADVVFRQDADALILDYKTGFNPHLTPSQRSWQLRVLAVIEYNQRRVPIRVGFIKPKAYEKSDCTDYAFEDLEFAHQQIMEVLRRSKEPDAPRYAGSHCNYCPARNRCPEAAAYSMLPSVMANTSVTMSKKEVIARVQKLTPADWKFIVQRGPMTVNIIEASKASLKALSVEELLAIGMTIDEGRRMPQIDAGAAFAVLSEFISTKALWSCFELSKGALIKAVAQEKILTEAQAKVIVEEKLKPFTDDTRRSAGSLEEV